MEFGQQFLAVVMVLGILCGALWLLKRKGMVQTAFRRSSRTGEPRLEVMDRLSLTPQHSVHLIRVADRTLLVGVSPGGCSLLESSTLKNMAAAELRREA
jgi:flagellar biosynthetic protein FliO